MLECRSWKSCLSQLYVYVVGGRRLSTLVWRLDLSFFKTLLLVMVQPSCLNWDAGHLTTCFEFWSCCISAN